MPSVAGVLMGMERRTPTTQQENHQQDHELSMWSHQLGTSPVLRVPTT